ncbi:MAG: TetR/AcrR family transcriptional regulator [Candidatus Obscuribacterales bacterium]|nr:TetR/AcrR family transcriptional regulator [Candidatus Obscuribacterales bacterium]
MTVSDRKRPGRPKDEMLTARREEEILAAATRYFAVAGYHNADLQMLADELGVGKGTLYRYFRTKEDLFLSSVDRGMRELHSYIEERTTGVADPIDRLRNAVRAFLSFFDGNPEMVELLIQERAEFRDRLQPTYLKHREANIGPWQEMLRKVINEGRIRKMPVSRITDVLSNLLYGTIFTQHFMRKKVPLERQAEDILDVVFLGLLDEQERHKQSSTAHK